MNDRTTTVAPSPPRATPRWRVGAALGLVVLGACVYTARGPLRSADDPRDFLLIHAAARAWLHGGNPYNLNDQYQAYLTALGPEDVARPAEILDSLYPPTTFVVLAPVAWMSLDAAHAVWIIMNTVMIFIVFLAWLRVAGVPWSSARGLGVLAVLLLAGPVHSVVTYGHMTLAVVAAAGLALLAIRCDRHLLVGVLLGLATAAKPQLAGLFIVGLLLVGKWRPAVWAGAVVLAILGLSVLRMHLAGVDDWLTAWQANVQVFTQSNEPGDATWGAKLRWQLINLAPVLFSFTGSAAVVQFVSVGFTLAVLGTVAALHHRAAARPSLLGLFAILAVLTLLPVYHRYYDAAMLIVPFIWAVAALRTPARRWAVAALAVMAVFMVPSSTLVHHLAVWGNIPPALADSFAWQAVVKLHQNYLLIALLVIVTLTWPMANRPTHSSTE